MRCKGAGDNLGRDLFGSLSWEFQVAETHIDDELASKKQPLIHSVGLAAYFRKGRLSDKEVSLISMVSENSPHTPTEATTNQDVGVKYKTLAFHLQL